MGWSNQPSWATAYLCLGCPGQRTDLAPLSSIEAYAPINTIQNREVHLGRTTRKQAAKNAINIYRPCFISPRGPTVPRIKIQISHQGVGEPALPHPCSYMLLQSCLLGSALPLPPSTRSLGLALVIVALQVLELTKLCPASGPLYRMESFCLECPPPPFAHGWLFPVLHFSG